MARINLLPWREQRRKAREKEFFAMLGAAAGAAVLSFLGLMLYFGGQIDGQLERNAYLEREIAQLDVKIKEIEELDQTRERLLSRKKAIEELQADRARMVHLFDELVRTVPDGVYLRTVKQAGEVLTLEGNAESNTRVATYMRSLEASEWLENPDLGIVQTQADPSKEADPRNRYAFILRITLSKPKGQGTDDGLDAGADPTAPASATPIPPPPSGGAT